MQNLLENRKLINLFHVLVVAPLIWALATNRIPENYKQYIVWLALAVALFHLYKFVVSRTEGMESVFGSNVHQIKIFDSSPGYDQPKLTVNKGDIIVWTNVGEVEHTVTADNDQFNSGYIKPGEHFSVKFDFPGEYYYSCMYHKGWMKGVVIVK
ncbi:blue type 1 copper protein [Fadolivirus algeromassiliense]|jgi:plastocyanin|uniref:Blue type 1 copper protein n=1 Tax=Fadolivirus FV1/VV64 TaxID=3070911 RepID=A0A7D3QVK4_9VIRU|nr:blue type 1 copper protein [Fadolivirus algeromassiliense]QKF93619.1 blue type 1 copper protein [Fadolivirus FV1/VV64]